MENRRPATAKRAINGESLVLSQIGKNATKEKTYSSNYFPPSIKFIAKPEQSLLDCYLP